MRPSATLTLIGTAFILATTSAALPAAEAHDHGHAAQGQAAVRQLQLDHGKRWATDASLRAAMDALHVPFAEHLPQIHAGKLDAAAQAELGAALAAALARIVAECKLPAKADAMLHLVVADLGAAADVLQGKAPGRPAAAAHAAVRALNAYGRHFDHPRWQALK